MTMADGDGDFVIDVDELDSETIAAAMGFSSFGTQARPNKKRRFNPQADAVIGTPRDGRPPAALPSAGTGANATRLPPRLPRAMAPELVSASVEVPAEEPVEVPASTASSLPLHPPHKARSKMKLPPPATANADEINVDDDDNDDGDDANDKSESTPAQVDKNDDETGPQYLDTSRPVGEIRDHLGQGEDGNSGDLEEDDEALQARIDAVVAAGNTAYGLPPRPPQHQLDGASHSTGRQRSGVLALDRHGFRPDLMPGAQRHALAAFGGADSDKTAVGQFLESELGDLAPQLSSLDGHSQGSWPGCGQGKGVGQRRGLGPSLGHSHSHQQDWWTGYYDPTSNENPWARVEAKLGLPECVGSWLERGHGRGQDRYQQ
ncbi:hypothetical protein SEPCBS57363_000050 [Sporothrix epigloea]|uniref:Uncharacterized protein n=1 Tax=Sporothrix epigloea TaxID=1892477 RepID=A0ABP0D320_9PEZI